MYASSNSCQFWTSSLKACNVIYEWPFINQTIWSIFLQSAKGQLISKCLFGVFNFFQRNKQKQVNLRFHSSKIELVCSFFGKTSGWKNHFDFVWPLVCPKPTYVVKSQADKFMWFTGCLIGKKAKANISEG